MEDVLVETTQRQYEAWQEFLDEEENRTNLHDYYLIQLTQTVIGLVGKSPPLKELVLAFKKEEAKKEERVVTEEDVNRQTLMAKARWFSAIGVREKIE